MGSRPYKGAVNSDQQLLMHAFVQRTADRIRRGVQLFVHYEGKGDRGEQAGSPQRARSRLLCRACCCSDGQATPSRLMGSSMAPKPIWTKGSYGQSASAGTGTQSNRRVPLHGVRHLVKRPEQVPVPGRSGDRQVNCEPFYWIDKAWRSLTSPNRKKPGFSKGACGAHRAPKGCSAPGVRA